MKRFILTLLFAFLVSSVYGQAGDGSSVNFKLIGPSAINGTTSKNFNYFWEYNGDTNVRANLRKANYYTSGFYALWIRGVTVGGGTDSLTIDCFPRNFEGTLGDQDSTIVTTRFDWTSGTWHGPFNFTLDPSAGAGCRLTHEGIVDADTANWETVLYY